MGNVVPARHSLSGWIGLKAEHVLGKHMQSTSHDDLRPSVVDSLRAAMGELVYCYSTDESEKKTTYRPL